MIPKLIADLRGRINKEYAHTRGTESYERRICAEALEAVLKLQGALDGAAETRGLWAPIAKPKRGKEWIVWTSVRSTRRAALDAYLDGVSQAARKEYSTNVRFARVFIREY